MELRGRGERGREGAARSAPWRPEIDYRERMTVDRGDEILLRQLENGRRIGRHAKPFEGSALV
jgi:hypothetical protein